MVTATLRDSVPITALRVYIDSGTTPVAQQFAFGYDSTVVGLWQRRAAAYVPTSGRHRITVAVDDQTGRTVSASLTPTFRLPEVAYTATALQDLGHDAAALHLNAAGDVVGWVRAPDQTQRPARWRSGTLTVLSMGDATSAIATRVNSTGDVLLQYQEVRRLEGYPPSSSRPPSRCFAPTASSCRCPGSGTTSRTTRRTPTGTPHAATTRAT